MSKLKEIWMRKMQGDFGKLAFSKKAGRCVLGSEKGAIFCLDKIGKTLWEAQLGGRICDIRITDDSRFTYASLYMGKICCLDKNGFETWEYETEKSLSCMDYSQKGKMIVAGSDDGTFFNINYDGELRWTKDLGKLIEKIAISQDGKITLVKTDGSEITALDDMGEILWKKSMENQVVDFAKAPKEIILAECGSDPRLIILDIKGNQVRSIQMHSNITLLEYVQKISAMIVVTDENIIQYMNESGVVISEQKMEYDIMEVVSSKEGNSIIILTKNSTVISMENVDDDTEIFYEILCRGKDKCGTFVSAVYTGECPKCSSERNVVRIIKEKL